MKAIAAQTNASVVMPHSILQGLADELARGIKVMSYIDDVAYRRVANGTGSVGAQFRHNLDIARILLNGIATGHIDYNKRERNIRIEEDRQFAVCAFSKVISQLAGLDESECARSVLVRSEIDQARWLYSSFGREAEFVHSHTVHHHALISEKLAGMGITVPGGFGVAPSTIEYWKQKAA